MVIPECSVVAVAVVERIVGVQVQSVADLGANPHTLREAPTFEPVALPIVDHGNPLAESEDPEGVPVEALAA